MVDATACIMILILGAVMCPLLASWRLLTTTAPPDYPARNSPGWQAFGVGEERANPPPIRRGGDKPPSVVPCILTIEPARGCQCDPVCSIN